MPLPPTSRKTVLEGIVKKRRHEMAAGVNHVAGHYTDEQFHRIADVGGVTDVRARDTLRLGIEHAASWFLSDLRSLGHPTPSEIEGGLEKVQKSASRLLRALGLTEVDDPYDGMAPGALRDCLEWTVRRDAGDESDMDAEAELRELVAVVGKIEALAKMARAEAARDKGQGEHKGNEALNEFISNLMRARKRAGGKPRLSRNPGTGVPSGPTLRFVRTCLGHLIENLRRTDPALAKHIPNQSDEALAHRIRRSKSRPAKSVSKKT